MVYLPWILVAVSYLFGAIPIGVLVARARGVDLRTVGSGNIGATNVGRALGPGLGGVVWVADLLKGLIPVVWAGQLLGGMEVPWPWIAAVGFAAPFGHSFSPYLRLRGGRGVSTSLGVLLGVDWRVGLGALVVWGLVVGITRYVSLGSILAAVSIPVLLALLPTRPNLEAARQPYLYLGVALAALIVLRHLPNLVRLIRGEESRIGDRPAGLEGAALNAPESETEYR